jgi:hypothetical protein
MPNARYSFRRGKGLSGFFSTHRASTDALNALQVWVESAGRSYEVLEDEDDELVVDLSFNESDASAGPDLDQASEKYGVERAYIPYS